MLKKKKHRRKKSLSLSSFASGIFQKVSSDLKNEAPLISVRQVSGFQGFFYNRTDLTSCCADTRIQHNFPEPIDTSSLLITVILLHYFNRVQKNLPSRLTKSPRRSPRLRKPQIDVTNPSRMAKKKMGMKSFRKRKEESHGRRL